MHNESNIWTKDKTEPQQKLTVQQNDPKDKWIAT